MEKKTEKFFLVGLQISYRNGSGTIEPFSRIFNLMAVT